MRQSIAFLVLTAGFSLGFGTSATFAETRKTTAASQTGQVVEVQGVSVEGNTVNGVLVNRSSKTLRDIRLVVRHAWLWKNERNPGNDNPGRAEFFSFTGDIAPGTSAPFTYRLKSAPAPRGDGKFVTSAEVTSYALVGK